MGIWEALTELVDLAKPWAEAQAEAPAKDDSEKVRVARSTMGDLRTPNETSAIVAGGSLATDCCG